MSISASSLASVPTLATLPSTAVHIICTIHLPISGTYIPEVRKIQSSKKAILSQKVQPKSHPKKNSPPSTPSNARATPTHGNPPERAYTLQLAHLCSPPIPHCPYKLSDWYRRSVDILLPTEQCAVFFKLHKRDFNLTVLICLVLLSGYASRNKGGDYLPRIRILTGDQVLQPDFCCRCKSRKAVYRTRVLPSLSVVVVVKRSTFGGM